ncbi:hypothetical protein [Chryseobacterium shigense]|uniref:Uncharacterized protein n=1 Tax=Chryseobacterium shigense TaxID=297244 RepID=A0A841N5U8_9FLAO|nr:hypothetical protein [Chryseobacterium shigense]MBB6371887.1 hypothetical protein [Chryseobacterium shigense]
MRNLIDFGKYNRRRIILSNAQKLSVTNKVVIGLGFLLFAFLIININGNPVHNYVALGIIVLIFLAQIIQLSINDVKQLKLIVPDYKANMLSVDWMHYKLIHEYNLKIGQSDLVNLGLEDLNYNMLIVEANKPIKPSFNYNIPIILISVISLILANYSPLFQFIKLDGINDQAILLALKNIWKILTIVIIMFLFIIFSSFYFSYIYYDSAKGKYEQYLQKKELINFLIFHKNNPELNN